MVNEDGQTATQSPSSELKAIFNYQIYTILTTPIPAVMATVLTRVNGVLIRSMNTVQIKSGDQLIAYTPALPYPVLQAGGIIGYMPAESTSLIQIVELPCNVDVTQIIGDDELSK